VADHEPTGLFGKATCVVAVVAGMKAGAVYGSTYGWVALAAVCLLGWVAHSWYNPLTDCVWCGSRSKRRSKGGTGKTFHFCVFPRWLGGCDGTGRRPRILTLITKRGLGRL
jgi:hypothetical protein